jgi:hypothetical protein
MDKHKFIAFIGWLIVASLSCIMFALLLSPFIDREPIKERQQVVLIKSIGVWHKYIVDGKSVIVEYEEVE